MVANFKRVSKEQLVLMYKIWIEKVILNYVIEYKVNQSITEIISTSCYPQEIMNQYLNYKLKSLLHRNLLCFKLLDIIYLNQSFKLFLRITVHPEVGNYIFKDESLNELLLSVDETNIKVARLMLKSFGELDEFVITDNLEPYNIDGNIFIRTSTDNKIKRLKTLISLDYGR